jgi:hypothetical protein
MRRSIKKSYVIGVLSIGLFCLITGAGAQSREGQPRRWRVMVIVQEQHLQRPRVPDPAVETALSKELIEAGYKVIDQDRLRELRYTEVMDRIIAGGKNAADEARKLGRKFGADILITGEAFTQEETRENVTTDLGVVTRIRCRGRVELKGVRMDTGEKFYSDSIHKTGAPESTVELSSKICLQQAAEDISASVLRKLDKLSLSPGLHIELDVRGIGSLSLSNELVKVLEKIPGVLDVGAADYEARTLKTEVHIDSSTVRDFAAKLETHSALKRFHLRVESSNGSKIVATAKP